MSRATSSLPVPLSPCTRIDTFCSASFSIDARSCRIGADVPMMLECVSSVPGFCPDSSRRMREWRAAEWTTSTSSIGRNGLVR